MSEPTPLPLKATCIPDVLDDARLSLCEFRVYCHLRRRARNKDSCFPSIDGISKTCGISVKTSKKAINGLIKRQMIQRESRPGRPSTYTLSRDQPGVKNDPGKKVPRVTEGPRVKSTPAKNLPQGPGVEITLGVGQKVPHEGMTLKDDRQGLVHSLPAREAPVVDEAPVSLENAISRGEEMAIVRGVVEQWWHARNAVGWVRGVGGRRVTGWESDLVTFKNAYNENTHSKNGNSPTKPDVDIYADGF